MKITFRLFLLVTLTAFFGCDSVEQDKPNILFIAVDDLRPELGAYGNEIIQTPNFDRLASEGVLFTNHFVQVPTCGASRHALLTGRLPRSRKDIGNNAIVASMSDQPEGIIPESFVHSLKRNGYYTVGIGKISHSADGLVYGYEEEVSQKLEMPHSWDERLFDAGKWETGWNSFFAYSDGSNRQSKKRQVLPYERGEVNDEGYPDGLSAKLAVGKLRELAKGEKPFFLGVGFFKPHLPFTSPAKYWDLYDSTKIPIAEFQRIPENGNRSSLHNSGEFNGYALGPEKASLDTTLSAEYSRKVVHAYYACVSYIDAQIGKLINEIEALGLSNNTVVVIWGDHGWHLGDQRVWGKHTLFERALRSTLIIKVPGKKSAVSDNVVSSIDIYPTLMDLSGIQKGEQLDGHSLVPLLNDVDADWNNAAYGYFRNGITLRTDSYRLSRYYNSDDLKVELYDHRQGRGETVNIAAENPEIVQQILPELEKGNTGLYRKD